jgi:hypothetical protein
MASENKALAIRMEIDPTNTGNFSRSCSSLPENNQDSTESWRRRFDECLYFLRHWNALTPEGRWLLDLLDWVVSDNSYVCPPRENSLDSNASGTPSGATPSGVVEPTEKMDGSNVFTNGIEWKVGDKPIEIDPVVPDSGGGETRSVELEELIDDAENSASCWVDGGISVNVAEELIKRAYRLGLAVATSRQRNELTADS